MSASTCGFEPCQRPRWTKPDGTAKSAWCRSHDAQYRRAGCDVAALRPIRQRMAPVTVLRPAETFSASFARITFGYGSTTTTVEVPESDFADVMRIVARCIEHPSTAPNGPTAPLASVALLAKVETGD